MKPFAYEIRRRTQKPGEGKLFKNLPVWAKGNIDPYAIEKLYTADQVAELLPKVDIQSMKLTDGRTDYFVRITVEDRSVTPHVFREKFKSEYHVALYQWLFAGEGEEPYVRDFDDDEWPARTLSPQEGLAELLEEARSEIVVALAFLSSDLKSDRLENTADQLIDRLLKIDSKILEAQRK